jgi:SAM-dependent methyltransferase
VTGGDAVDEPDASFDVALSSLAVHHIPADRRAATIREIHRLLRPGGRLVVADLRAVGGHLADQVADAGLTVTGTGSLRPLLSYVTARRE